MLHKLHIYKNQMPQYYSSYKQWEIDIWLAQRFKAKCLKNSCFYVSILQKQLLIHVHIHAFISINTFTFLSLHWVLLDSNNYSSTLQIWTSFLFNFNNLKLLRQLHHQYANITHSIYIHFFKTCKLLLCFQTYCATANSYPEQYLTLSGYTLNFNALHCSN